MIKILMTACLLFFSITIYAEKPAGFLWYNLPKQEKTEQKPSVSFQSLSYTDKDAVLKFYTLEALHKVRFTHALSDERTFLAWQDFWLKEATLHGKLNEAALLAYPEFDFSVTHPTSHLGVKLNDALDAKEAQTKLHALSKNHGLLFFYRGGHPLDLAQISILKAFCKAHHFTLLAVSVDGAISELLPQSKVDMGQAASLNIRHFPALVLVNPKTQEFKPVAFGLTTQDVLTRHLVEVQR